ncbi:hypothetical protein [Sorangium sp. So ce131]|uniref:hypothetical protein n=1 Tax=Sorangium sp. So ce131 TaxID=3133282 RepID=UPI003F5F8875
MNKSNRSKLPATIGRPRPTPSARLQPRAGDRYHMERLDRVGRRLTRAYVSDMLLGFGGVASTAAVHALTRRCEVEVLRTRNGVTVPVYRADRHGGGGWVS